MTEFSYLTITNCEHFDRLKKKTGEYSKLTVTFNNTVKAVIL